MSERQGPLSAEAPWETSSRLNSSHGSHHSSQVRAANAVVNPFDLLPQAPDQDTAPCVNSGLHQIARVDAMAAPGRAESVVELEICDSSSDTMVGGMPDFKPLQSPPVSDAVVARDGMQPSTTAAASAPAASSSSHTEDVSLVEDTSSDGSTTSKKGVGTNAQHSNTGSGLCLEDSCASLTPPTPGDVAARGSTMDLLASASTSEPGSFADADARSSGSHGHTSLSGLRVAPQRPSPSAPLLQNRPAPLAPLAPMRPGSLAAIVVPAFGSPALPALGLAAVQATCAPVAFASV
jgi:hypothetical protein